MRSERLDAPQLRSVGGGLKGRPQFQFLTLRGREEGSLLIAARSNVYSEMKLLLWERATDGKHQKRETWTTKYDGRRAPWGPRQRAGQPAEGGRGPPPPGHRQQTSWIARAEGPPGQIWRGPAEARSGRPDGGLQHGPVHN